MKMKSYRRARWLAAGVAIASAPYGAYAGIAWAGYGDARPPHPDEQDDLLDRFIPSYGIGRSSRRASS
jgi:hypothetical protein